MELTTIEQEHYDRWLVRLIVLVILALYTTFFFAALGVALVFLDQSTCRAATHCPQLLALYASWAACALLFTPVLRYVRGTILPPLTPGTAALAFKHVGCPLYLFVVLMDYLAVTTTELDSLYAVVCTGAAGAATVSFVGVLVFCVWLVSGQECRDVDFQLRSGHELPADDAV